MIHNRLQILNLLHTTVQSKEPFVAKSLQLRKHGNPAEVLKIGEETLKTTHDNQVLLKILAAPIHPIHMELIKGHGSYGTAPIVKFPIVPGSECVAEIASIGENVRELSVGQRVIVPYAESVSKRGTWSTYALYNANEVLPISQDIGIAEAATLCVYPCAAYRILKDFVTLKPGDCVLFNGGFSAIGQALHQLCKAWDLYSVSVVRHGSDELKRYLKSLGATEVFTYSEMVESNIFENGTLPKPRLSLSCTARSSSKILGQYLSSNGIMISYGSMAGYPTTAATASFTFKDFVLRPFWIVRWNKNNPKMDERKCMFDELCNLVKEKKFRAPEMTCIPFSEYQNAFDELEKVKGFIGTKFLLDMSSDK